jgi:hypothetical protein
VHLRDEILVLDYCLSKAMQLIGFVLLISPKAIPALSPLSRPQHFTTTGLDGRRFGQPNGLFELS